MNRKLQNAKCELRIANLRFAICILHFAIAMAVVVAAPGVALAGDVGFPRGPGFYFSIPKLLVLLLVYAAWVRTAWWLDRDAQEVGMPRIM